MPNLKLNYFAWLSTEGEKEALQEGALYAGDIKNVPQKYKDLLVENQDDSKGRRYCIIFEEN